MTVYGEFDGEHRPRPSPWRLAAVGFCQTLFAIWISIAIVSLIDSYLLHKADVKDYLPIYTPPWQTLKGELSGSVLIRAVGSDLPLRYETEFAAAALPVAGILAALGIVMTFFWPSRPTLARRLFLHTFGPALTLFGAALFLTRGSVSGVSRSSLVPYAALGVALIVTILAETKTIRLLSTVYGLREPSRRVGLWFLRYVPAVAAIGATAYASGNYEVCVYGAGFLLVTLFMNLIHAPRDHYEQLEHVEMREAAAALLFLAVAALAGAAWLFRLMPPRRTISLVDGRARVIAITELPRELLAHWKPPAPPPPPQPKIDIRWSRRPGGVRR